MKLDETAKIASIVSVVVGVFISAATYMTNVRLSSLQRRLGDVDVQAKVMDVDKKAYDLSARLMAEFSVPLARSFAIQYADRAAPGPREHVAFATPKLGEEITASAARWSRRQGLMTGAACADDGLRARQVVTLVVRNIGHADATDVRLTFLEQPSPHPDPATGWQARRRDGGPLRYVDLTPDSVAWTRHELTLETLRGASSPAEVRSEVRVVLASVSGRSTLFGTAAVPVELSWTDDITKRRQVMSVLRAGAGRLDAELYGAEIGTAGLATCR